MTLHLCTKPKLLTRKHIDFDAHMRRTNSLVRVRWGYDFKGVRSTPPWRLNIDAALAPYNIIARVDLRHWICVILFLYLWLIVIIQCFSSKLITGKKNCVLSFIRTYVVITSVFSKPNMRLRITTRCNHHYKIYYQIFICKFVFFYLI